MGKWENGIVVRSPATTFHVSHVTHVTTFTIINKDKVSGENENATKTYLKTYLSAEFLSNQSPQKLQP